MDLPSKFALNGFCSENYEPVKAHFEKMLLNGQEENAQLCIYVGDKCVVDLYGTAIGDFSYSSESIQNVMSCGKNWESIVMGMLYDKGLFKYEDVVAKHWPEFAHNGKEHVTIADVFRHQAGLAWFTESFSTIKDMWTENIKENKVGKMIEGQKLHYPEDTKSEYHGMTRGFIINELIRRLDSKGRVLYRKIG